MAFLFKYGGSANVSKIIKSNIFVATNVQEGPEIAAKIKIGTRVVRGKDWKWENQVFNNRDLLTNPSF